MNGKLISSITSYGKRYRLEVLSEYDSDKLLTDPWVALQFFFSHACYQGRRDEVSKRVYNAIISVLAPEFSDNALLTNYAKLSQGKWEFIETELRNRVGKGKVGRGRDIDMVLTTLDFIARCPGFNIVDYSVGQINSGRTSLHYEELQRSRSEKGIISVGPKIAAFYLRDVVSVYSLDEKVSPESSYCLQPIDVWVRKLARKTGIVDSSANDLNIQEAIVTVCKKEGVSPLLFNQGAWYIGYNAPDIVLEMLEQQN